MLKNSELADRLRQTAYFFWEQDGRPEGRSFDYWLRAKHAMLRQLAYDRWLAEGTPVDRADDHWHDAAKQIDGK